MQEAVRLAAVGITGNESFLSALHPSHLLTCAVSLLADFMRFSLAALFLRRIASLFSVLPVYGLGRLTGAFALPPVAKIAILSYKACTDIEGAAVVDGTIELILMGTSDRC